MLATSRYSPACSTRMSAILRTLPLLAPIIVTMITGGRCRAACWLGAPPDASYSATWSATHGDVLGSYSPTMGTAPPSPPGRWQWSGETNMTAMDIERATTVITPTVTSRARERKKAMS